MNTQTSQLPEGSHSSVVGEVLKLACPFCHGTLNLRRIHIGIEGQCVYCFKPVTAIEDESGCRLVSVEKIQDNPFPETAKAADPVASSPALEVPSGSVAQPISDAVTEPEIVAGEVPESKFDVPPAPSQSPWGFPEKEAEKEAFESLDSAPFSRLEPAIEPAIEPDPVEPVKDSAPTQPEEDSPFQSPSEPAEWLRETEPPALEVEEEEDEAEIPPPLPGKVEGPPFVPKNPVSFQKISEAIDASARGAAEKAPDSSVDELPAIDGIGEDAFPSPPPLESAPEAPIPGSIPPALPGITVGGDVGAANGHPLPGGISPFSTGSAKGGEPGFAESLFTEGGGAEAATTPPVPPLPTRPAMPDMSPPDDVALNAANQWGPPPNAKTADGEELDFSAVAPPPQPKAEVPDRAVTAKLPEKRKSGSGVFKKIFKFFLTIGIIGGIAFAANAFVPAAKWSELKQHAIDWLEPGAVILEKLPFGKNKGTGTVAPAMRAKPEPPTRQEIAEELLRVPQRQPGG